MSADGGVRPGLGWRWARRLTQAVTLVAIVVAPLLGGWQRLDRAEMASWGSEGRELPAAVRERLPLGQAPSRAHERNRLLGGGAAADWLSIPIVDPVAGAVALTVSPATARGLLAVALPLLLALVGGRVFCGWFCPFGVVARALDRLVARLPLRRFAVPDRRPVRWLLLAGVLVASLLGVHLLLYLLLPHLLVQQSVYAAWLLGGGSAVVAVLLGLVVAGLILGPTTYCAAICPTGAALALAGSRRVVRLRIAEPAGCGPRCDRCDRACWLQLDPASGDPGPDCDLCARCVTACPRADLRVGIGPGARKTAAAAALLACAHALAPPVVVARGEIKPTLVLHGERVVEDVTVAVDVVDLTGVRLGVDSTEAQRGIELSVFVARGPVGAPDERGLLPHREVYDGPLTLRLRRADGPVLRLDVPAANSPVSTPLRTLYRRRLDVRLEPGDIVEIAPIEGWIATPQAFACPPPGATISPLEALGFLAASSLVFMGLMSLALAAAPGARGARAAARPAGAPARADA